MYNYYYNPELYHFGTKKHSGRYPYGSGARPFQDKERKRMSFRQRRAAKKEEKERAAQEKAEAEQRKKTLAAIREYQKEKEKAEAARLFREADKERVLTRGTASEVNQYRDELTGQQLKAVIERMGYYKTLDELAKKENYKPTTMDKFDAFMKTAGKVNGWATTSINAYKNFEAVLAILNGESKKR